MTVAKPEINPIASLLRIRSSIIENILWKGRAIGQKIGILVSSALGLGHSTAMPQTQHRIQNS
jgi:hypothetical protein